MGGMMGGGSGGGQETQNTGEYPAQFQPLAQGAANQILKLQKALPLARFANPNPGQTAGIAPFQQAAMNFMPNLLNPSWGLQSLQNMGGGMDAMMGNTLGANNPYNTALNALSSGGFGTGNPSFPQVAQPTLPNLNVPGAQPTVLGPGTEGLVASLLSQLSQPIPGSVPVLNAPVTGPIPQ